MLMNYKIILRVADEPVVKQSALSVPSEQTDPLQPLPTVFGSWMGNRITPSNLSELFCWWIVFIHTFFIEIIVFIVFNPTFRMINSPVKKIRRETPKSPMMSTRKNNQRWPEGPAATA